jgi:hypothetical protein
VEHRNGETDSPTLDVVGGGLSEWPSATGPRGEAVAPCAFVNVAGRPELLELAAQFHADPAAWRATGRWGSAGDAPRSLLVEVETPEPRRFELLFRAPRQEPFLAAVDRAGSLYVCPTTPSRGVNARLARDASFPVDLLGREA